MIQTTCMLLTVTIIFYKQPLTILFLSGSDTASKFMPVIKEILPILNRF